MSGCLTPHLSSAEGASMNEPFLEATFCCKSGHDFIGNFLNSCTICFITLN